MFLRLLNVLMVFLLVGCIQPTNAVSTQHNIASPQPNPVSSPTLSTSLDLSLLEDYLKLLSGNEKILNLIEEPICDLPCWWTITPGESNWTDSKNVILALDQTPILYKGSDTYLIYGVSYSFSNTINFMNFDFFVNKESKLVEFISFTSFLDPKILSEKYRLYSPKEIIKKYGQPSRIYLITHGVDVLPFGDKGNIPTYQMFLFYDEKSFLIIHTGYIEEVSDSEVTICPRLQQNGIIGIDIYIQSNKFETLLEKFPADKPFDSKTPYLRSISVSTGMSVEEFSNFILSDTNPCFLMKK